MSGVFQNIDPPPPQRPAFFAKGGHTRWVERGWGVNSWEDARHCSVLYICKYFVHITQSEFPAHLYRYCLCVPVSLKKNKSIGLLKALGRPYFPFMKEKKMLIPSFQMHEKPAPADESIFNTPPTNTSTPPPPLAYIVHIQVFYTK
jgi:hypothetical protein